MGTAGEIINQLVEKCTALEAEVNALRKDLAAKQDSYLFWYRKHEDLKESIAASCEKPIEAQDEL